MIFELCEAIYAIGSRQSSHRKWLVVDGQHKILSSFHNFFSSPKRGFYERHRPFYSGLIKEPRGEPKIRNASGIWRAISRYTSPVNEIHLHCDKCPRALAGIDSWWHDRVNVECKILFPPLNRIRIFCFDTTWNLWEPYGYVIKLY